ncbi:unnamed protein product, partial [Cylicostephanus goldi]
MPGELAVASAIEETQWTKEVPVYRYNVADFIMSEGHLMLVDKDRLRKVVPPGQRKKLLEDAHYGRWAEECRECLRHNPQRAMVPPLKPIVTIKPFEVVGMDILEMGPKGIVPSKAASVVAHVFFERWVADGRQPKRVLSDQGGEFENKLMDELSKLLGIQPRENGITERFNQTIIAMLKKKVRVAVEWDKILPACHHRARVNRGVSLLFATRVRCTRPLRPGGGGPHADSTGICPRGKNDRMRDRMKAVYYREKGVNDCPSPPKVGNRVYMKIPGEKRSSRNSKLVNPWKGPYRVLKT